MRPLATCALALVVGALTSAPAFALAEITTGGTVFSGEVLAEAATVTFDGTIDAVCSAELAATVDAYGLGEITALTYTSCVAGGLVPCDIAVTGLPYGIVLDYGGGSTTTGTGTATILDAPSATADCGVTTCAIDAGSGDLVAQVQGGNPATLEFDGAPLTSDCGAMTLEGSFEVTAPAQGKVQPPPALPLSPQGATPGAWGAMGVTTASTKDITFKNTSQVAVTVDSLGFTGGAGRFAFVNIKPQCFGSAVATNATCNSRVEFTSGATANRKYTGILSLLDPGANVVGFVLLTGSS